VNEQLKTNPSITRDGLWGGRVWFFQSTRGYRVTLDPVLLTAFVGPHQGSFVDVGAATGVLSFLLLVANPRSVGTAVEIQSVLADLAERGLDENQLRARLGLVRADVRVWSRLPENLGRYDLVVSNPPFRRVGDGCLPSDPQRRLAHHEVALSLAQWSQAARALVTPSGRVAVVFPAERQDELLASLNEVGLFPWRLRQTVSRCGGEAVRVMVEARPDPPAGGCVVERSLIVHTEQGLFTKEAQSMIDGPLEEPVGGAADRISHSDRG